MEAGTRGFPRLGVAFGHEKWGKSGDILQGGAP